MLNGKRIDGTVGDALPIGTLSPFVGLVAPKGYLICMGQLVDKAKYPELWELCGDTFGQSTATQFYLPDLRGQVIAGYKQGDSTFGTLGALIGGKTTSYTPAGTNTGGSVGNHTLTTSEIPSHNHAMKTRYDDYNWDNGYGSVQGVKRAGAWAAILSDWSTEYGGIYDFEKDWPVTNTGGGGAHNHGFTNPTFTGTQANISTVQPTAVMNWIIKASMIAVIESNIEDSLTSTSSTDALSAKQGKVLNDKITSLEAKKKVLRIKRSGVIEWTGMSTPQTMPYNVIDYNSSDGALTHYNSNSIKIGTGVSQIRVTAQITTDYPSSDNVSFYQFIYLYKNNTQVFKTISPIFRWIDFGIYGVVLDVTEGDIITCKISTNYTGVYQLAPNYSQFGDGAIDYMQVEVLK